MLKLPKSVKVAGFTYKIIPVASKDEVENEVKGACGYVDFRKQEIIICTAYSNERQLETLLHEILHTVHFHYHIESVVSDPDIEEHLTTKVSEGIFQVFKDNPEVLPLFKRV